MWVDRRAYFGVWLGEIGLGDVESFFWRTCGKEMRESYKNFRSTVKCSEWVLMWKGKRGVPHWGQGSDGQQKQK